MGHDAVQAGASLTGAVTQDGMGNLVTASETGYTNSYGVTQTGTHNTATVTQQ